MKKVHLKWMGLNEFSVEEFVSCREIGPKYMMLAALGKCAALTSLAIMDKMRVELQTFEITAEGEIDETDEQATFTKFSLIFNIECEPQAEQRAISAIEKSVEKYCPLSNMYRHIAPIKHYTAVNGRDPM